tara:strand:+ start:111 stop:374 length:264 start_codon:yes stop_codon:yes gene_type:complete
MSESVMEQLAEIIMDNCDDREEIEALIDNVLVLIAEMIDDDEWEPCVKDLRQMVKDNKDDEDLCEASDLEEEELEVKDEGDGFVSLK